MAGSICQTSLYTRHRDETKIKKLFRSQIEVFVRKNVDFLIAEVSLVLGWGAPGYNLPTSPTRAP